MENILDKIKPTERFTNRVENYVKYRPSYPDTVIKFLCEETDLQKDWNIADIGAGTGIFSELLLKNGYKVWGVEPNRAMREAAEKHLRSFNKFTSVDATAENTSLQDRSINLITVAQAFHWMNPHTTKQEFRRILKTPGFIALIWNIRLTNTPFLQKLEQLKADFGTDYKATRIVKEDQVQSFFEPAAFKKATLPHSQLLNREGFKGQLLSSSYMPLEGSKYMELDNAMNRLFEQYEEDGLVKIDFETKIYLKV